VELAQHGDERVADYWAPTWHRQGFDNFGSIRPNIFVMRRLRYRHESRQVDSGTRTFRNLGNRVRLSCGTEGPREEAGFAERLPTGMAMLRDEHAPRPFSTTGVSAKR